MSRDEKPPIARPSAAGLEDALAKAPWLSELSAAGDRTVLDAPSDRLAESVRLLLKLPGARFADVFATAGDPLTLRTVIALDGDARYVIVQTRLSSPQMPWLSDATPGAFVEECELFERHGLQPPEGHLLNRLAVPPVSAPEHPRLEQHEAPTRATHVPHTVGGHAFEFPVGPVRSAATESLYYGLVTSGEEVVELYLHTWHKYRDIERRLEGMPPRKALFLVERAEGLSAVASAVAFATAVESALGLAVPGEVTRDRLICLELERLYNHAQCSAALAQSTGLFIAQAQFEIALERLLRLNAAVTGHRYLFGTVDIARSGRRLDLAALADLSGAQAELCRVLDAALQTNSFLDRLEATGIIAADDVPALGLVGPVARACGVPVDVRVDHPLGGTPLPALCAALAPAGDALARLQVRRQEIGQSADLIGYLADARIAPRPAAGERPGWGLGTAESPRGENLAWVALDESGRITRARLRTASARNWRAFDDAARSQNVFTDIPIIEASFWLTVAGRVT